MMTTHNQNSDVAHSLYVLYEILSDEAQQLFLQELISKQKEKIEDLAFYLDCKQENEFLDDRDAQM